MTTLTGPDVMLQCGSLAQALKLDSALRRFDADRCVALLHDATFGLVEIPPSLPGAR